MNLGPQVQKGPIVIIGAGPAGLGAAYMLDRAGYPDWVLFEREAHVGGLATSFTDEKGYTWDLGGHVAFSHYDLVSRLYDDLLGETGWIEHERESWIRVLERWVPYPFQNNIHRLPPEEAARCAEGLIRAKLADPKPPFEHFGDFIEQVFGEGIADLFMRPYNYKVWAYPPPMMDAGWIADRVSVPDPVRVVRNLALGTDDCAWGPNNMFRFPRHGGTGAIWRAMAARLPQERIHTGREVVSIDPDKRTIRLNDGSTQDYAALISTMPLDLLTQATGRSAWSEAASELLYSSTYIVGIGLKGSTPEHLRTKCWMYFPEANCPFYRVTHFSLYSPNNVDDIEQHWSLMCEVSESPEKPVRGDRVVEDTVNGLVAAGLIESPQEVVHSWSYRVERSYPIPSKRRDATLNRLLPELYEHDILSRGRFGAWRYEVGNMDHSFMQGFEAASHLIGGNAELTLWHPEVVNVPHPVLGWGRVR